MDINENKYDKWVGILSIALIAIVATVFFAVISSKHLAKGTFATSSCPDGYKFVEGNYDFCCPEGYEHFNSVDQRCYKTGVYLEALAQYAKDDGMCGGFTIDNPTLTLEECLNVYPQCTEENGKLIIADVMDCYRNSKSPDVMGCSYGNTTLGTKDGHSVAIGEVSNGATLSCCKAAGDSWQYSEDGNGYCYIGITNSSHTSQFNRGTFKNCPGSDWHYISESNTCMKCTDNYIFDYGTYSCIAPSACDNVYTSGAISDSYVILNSSDSSGINAACCEGYNGYTYTDDGNCVTKIEHDDLVAYYKKPKIACFGDGYISNNSGTLCVNDPSVQPPNCSNVYTSGTISGNYAILHSQDSSGVNLYCCEQYNGYTYTDNMDCVTQITIDDGIGSYKKPKIDCFGEGYAVDSTGNLCTNNRAYTLADDATVLFHNGGDTFTVTCTPSSASSSCKIKRSDVPNCPSKWCEGSDFTSCIDNLDSYFNITSFSAGTTSNYYCDTSTTSTVATLLFHNGSNTTTLTCTPTSGSSFCKVNASDVPSCPKWCEGSDFTSCIDNLNSYFTTQSFSSGTTSNYYCNNDASAAETARVGFNVNETLTTLTCTPKDASTTCNLDASKIPACEEWCYNSNKTQCDFSSTDVVGPYNAGYDHTFYCKTGSTSTPSSPTPSSPTPSTPTPSSPTPSTPTPSSPTPSTPSPTSPASSSSEPPENPQTGGMSIVFIWILGIMAMLYSFWYFKKSKLLKSE